MTPPTRAGKEARPINSENSPSTQCFAPIGFLGDPDVSETPTNDMTQNASAKSPKAHLVARIARLVRQAGLDYDGWRYVAKRVRKVCDLKPEKTGSRLPRVLTTEEFHRLYALVQRDLKISASFSTARVGVARDSRAVPPG